MKHSGIYIENIVLNSRTHNSFIFDKKCMNN
jgi:hypothetical protein